MLRSAFGHIRLDYLTHTHTATALDALRKDGKGERTIQVAYDTPRVALNWVVKRDRVLVGSPITSVVRPKSEREISYLNRAEAKRFLSAVKDDQYRAIFHFAIFLGMRLGEILGLHWRDVDLDGKTITVSQQLGEGRLFGKPKSRSSRRRIDLPASIVAELRAHKARTKRILRKTGLVFTTRNSTALHPS